MATREMEMRDELRLNELDWDILTVMADGKRYTPAYLYQDVTDLEEYGDDWIRQRIKHLHDNGLIEKVGTSSMYTLTDWGQAALDIRPEFNEDEPPQDFAQRVIQRAASYADDSEP